MQEVLSVGLTMSGSRSDSCKTDSSKEGCGCVDVFMRDG